MLSRPQLRLLSLLAVLFAVVQSSWFDANIYGRDVVARQLSGSQSIQATGTTSETGSAPSSTSSVVDEETSTTTTRSATPSSSPTSETSTEASTTSSAPSITPSSTSSIPSTRISSSASVTPTKTSSTSSSDEETKTTSSRPTATTDVIAITLTTTESGTLVTKKTSSTVTSALPTGTAALNNGGTSSSSGMSSKTKNTIIGVVVGIGGAIILAGLGIVAFRIWGRRKNTDESDGLMGFGGSPRHEKDSSISAAGAPSPFQSTLENYHNPARNGNVNASSNF